MPHQSTGVYQQQLPRKVLSSEAPAAESSSRKQRRHRRRVSADDASDSFGGSSSAGHRGTSDSRRSSSSDSEEEISARRRASLLARRGMVLDTGDCLSYPTETELIKPQRSVLAVNFVFPVDTVNEDVRVSHRRFQGAGPSSVAGGGSTAGAGAHGMSASSRSAPQQIVHQEYLAPSRHLKQQQQQQQPAPSQQEHGKANRSATTSSKKPKSKPSPASTAGGSGGITNQAKGDVAIPTGSDFQAGDFEEVALAPLQPRQELGDSLEEPAPLLSSSVNNGSKPAAGGGSSYAAAAAAAAAAASSEGSPTTTGGDTAEERSLKRGLVVPNNSFALSDELELQAADEPSLLHALEIAKAAGAEREAQGGEKQSQKKPSSSQNPQRRSSSVSSSSRQREKQIAASIAVAASNIIAERLVEDPEHIPSSEQIIDQGHVPLGGAQKPPTTSSAAAAGSGSSEETVDEIAEFHDSIRTALDVMTRIAQRSRTGNDSNRAPNADVKEGPSSPDQAVQKGNTATSFGSKKKKSKKSSSSQSPSRISQEEQHVLLDEEELDIVAQHFRLERTHNFQLQEVHSAMLDPSPAAPHQQRQRNAEGGPQALESTWRELAVKVFFSRSASSAQKRPSMMSPRKSIREFSAAELVTESTPEELEERKLRREAMNQLQEELRITALDPTATTSSSGSGSGASNNNSSSSTTNTTKSLFPLIGLDLDSSGRCWTFLEPLRGLHVRVWKSYSKARFTCMLYQRLTSTLLLEHYSFGLLRGLVMSLYEVDGGVVTVTALPTMVENWRDDPVTTTLGSQRHGDRSLLAYMMSQLMWHVSLPVRLFDVYCENQIVVPLHRGQDGYLYLLNPEQLHDRTGDDATPMTAKANAAVQAKESTIPNSKVAKPIVAPAGVNISALKRGAVVSVAPEENASPTSVGKLASLAGGSRRGSVSGVGSSQGALVLSTMVFRPQWNFKPLLDQFHLHCAQRGFVDEGKWRGDTEGSAAAFLEYITDTIIPLATERLVQDAHLAIAAVNDHFILTHANKDEKMETCIIEMVRRNILRNILHELGLPMACMALVLRCCNEGNFGEDDTSKSPSNAVAFKRSLRRLIERRGEGTTEDNASDVGAADDENSSSSPKGIPMPKAMAAKHAEDTMARRIVMRVIKAEMLGRSAKQALRVHVLAQGGTSSQHTLLQIANRLHRMISEVSTSVDAKRFWENALLPLARRKYRLHQRSKDLLFADYKMVPVAGIMVRMLDAHPYAVIAHPTMVFRGTVSAALASGGGGTTSEDGGSNFSPSGTLNGTMRTQRWRSIAEGCRSEFSPSQSLRNVIASFTSPLSSSSAAGAVPASFASAASGTSATNSSTEPSSSAVPAYRFKYASGAATKHSVSFSICADGGDGLFASLQSPLRAVDGRMAIALIARLPFLLTSESTSWALHETEVGVVSATTGTRNVDETPLADLVALVQIQRRGTVGRQSAWIAAFLAALRAKHAITIDVLRKLWAEDEALLDEDIAQLKSDAVDALYVSEGTTTFVLSGNMYAYAKLEAAESGSVENGPKKRFLAKVLGNQDAVSTQHTTQASLGLSSKTGTHTKDRGGGGVASPFTSTAAAVGKNGIFGVKPSASISFARCQAYTIFFLMGYDPSVLTMLARDLDSIRFGGIELNDSNQSVFPVVSSIFTVVQAVSWHGLDQALGMQNAKDSPPYVALGGGGGSALQSQQQVVASPTSTTSALIKSSSKPTQKPQVPTPPSASISGISRRPPEASKIGGVTPPESVVAQSEAQIKTNRPPAAQSAQLPLDEDVMRWLILAFNLITTEVLKNATHVLDHCAMTQTIIAAGDGMHRRNVLHIVHFLKFLMPRYATTCRKMTRMDLHQRRSLTLRAMSTFSKMGKLISLPQVLEACVEMLDDSVYKTYTNGMFDFESDNSIRALLLVVLIGCARVEDAPRVACIRRLLHRVDNDDRLLVASLLQDQVHQEQAFRHAYWIFRRKDSLELLGNVQQEMKKRNADAHAQERLEAFLTFHKRLLGCILLIGRVGRGYMIRRKNYPLWVDFDARRTEAAEMAKIREAQDKKIAEYEEKERLRNIELAAEAEAERKRAKEAKRAERQRRKSRAMSLFGGEEAPTSTTLLSATSGTPSSTLFSNEVMQSLASVMLLDPRDTSKPAMRQRARSLFGGSTNELQVEHDDDAVSSVSSKRRKSRRSGGSDNSESDGNDDEDEDTGDEGGVLFEITMGLDEQGGNDTLQNKGDSTKSGGGSTGKSKTRRQRMGPRSPSPTNRKPLYCPPKPPAERRPKWITSFDRQKPRTVPFERPEENLLSPQSGYDMSTLLRKVFRYCDTNNDGFVTADEVMLAADEMELSFLLPDLRGIFGKQECRYVKQRSRYVMTFDQFENLVLSGCGLV